MILSNIFRIVITFAIIFFGVPLIGWFKTLLVLGYGIYAYFSGRIDGWNERQSLISR